MRANARAILLDALGEAHRWLDELLRDSGQTLETLAMREGKTERSIRMTLSLAFLAPDIVKAEVEGRLPRGHSLKRLVDLPMDWPDQWQALGLEAPARISWPNLKNDAALTAPPPHLSRIVTTLLSGHSGWTRASACDPE
jgi:hypothetical protein